MAETDLPWVFTEPLERAGVPYMIVDAFATLAFGVYRTTDDLDLVLALEPGNFANFENTFPAEAFYRPPRETLLLKFQRPERGHFNLIHQLTLHRAGCYLPGQDPLQFWGLKNRRPIELEGRRCWVAPPEAVILTKLEFFREGGSEKHISDIRAVLQLMDVDRAFIARQIHRLELEQEWQRCDEPPV